jgi:hypothetical protein
MVVLRDQIVEIYNRPGYMKEKEKRTEAERRKEDR